MQTSTTVAAVNKEMRRPGLEAADLGVIGDLATDVSASPSR
jgi:electron transfer flavoprotein alpha subunit